MAEVLARLGQTRQANNLNQIAKHLNQGTLIVDPELEEDLKRAVAEVAWMRATLMEALGVNHDPQRLSTLGCKGTGRPSDE